MGKGDKKTAKGKIFMGSNGVRRKKKHSASRIPAPVEKTTKTAVPKAKVTDPIAVEPISKKAEVSVEELPKKEKTTVVKVPEEKVKKPVAKKKTPAKVVKEEKE